MKSVSIGAKVDPALADKLYHLAQKERVSMAEMLRLLISRAR